jgi:hypothetical protein
VCKGADSRRQVPWIVDQVDEHTGEVTERVFDRAPYRTWSCSRAWGLTMAAIRQADLEKWQMGQAERDWLAEMTALSELRRGFAGEGWEVIEQPGESPPSPS